MRQRKMTTLNGRIAGNITYIRTIEDCIRATNKYTKGVFGKKVQHPIQGDGFPSKLLIEYYEVYPNTELSWDMPADTAWAWVWGDERHIDVLFKYDYRNNSASVEVQGGSKAVKELAVAIPGLDTILNEREDK